MHTQKNNLSEFDMSGQLDTPEMGANAGVELPSGEVDREGAMAKADLYKLANYAHKLYEKIQEDDQLEAWVQAKITKAADYMASVYHYLEYEMKFSEYGHHLDNSDTLSESQKQVLKARLNEAKAIVKQLKLQQVEKLSEATKTDKPWKDSSGKEHPGTAVKGDKYTGKEADKEAKAKKEKDLDEATKTPSEWTDSKGNKHPATKVKGDKYTGKEADKEAKEKKVDEATKTPAEWTDSKGNKHPATKVKGDKYTGKEADKESKAKKENDLDEAAPSAGMTAKEKSAVAKKAVAGKDIGKPGKNFDKVAKSAGGGEKGKKVAAAAMWKNAKKKVAEAAAEKKAKKDYDGDGKVESGKDEHAGSVDKAIKASKGKEAVNESVETSRMREQLARLNRNESQSLNESSEAASIRALTRLLG